MSSIGRVVTVRFTVFCNVHRPKCMPNEFSRNGRQRKVQYRGGGLSHSRQEVSDFRASRKVDLLKLTEGRLLLGRLSKGGGDLVLI